MCHHRSTVTGESSQQAAGRELFEELGLRLDLENTRPHLTINDINCFCDIYLLEHEIDIDSLTLQYEKVQAVKWASREEVISLLETNQFITYYKSFIELLFDSRKKYGSHQSENLK